MLHVTNGDVVAATLARTRIPGEIVRSDDPLHEGPVPAGFGPAELNAVRACFIAAQGWATREDALERLDRRDRVLAGAGEHQEVVLWLEPDLFDQLQLVFVLDRLSELGRPPLVSLVSPPGYLGPLSAGALAELFEGRVMVGDEAHEGAAAAWSAFRAPDPTALEAVPESSALPYLGAALRRHLEQFPSVEDGLGRTERQILEGAAEGAGSWTEAFRRDQAQEEWAFLGDSSYLLHVERLRAGGALDQKDFVLTGLGESLLSGGADWIEEAGVDRWLGGVHLQGRQVAWRWDRAGGQLVNPAQLSGGGSASSGPSASASSTISPQRSTSASASARKARSCSGEADSSSRP